MKAWKADLTVAESGCSLAQYCPCDDDWKNHGEYVSCVAHAAQLFLELGLIEDAGAIVSDAAQSDCGKKDDGNNGNGKGGRE